MELRGLRSPPAAKSNVWQAGLGGGGQVSVGLCLRSPRQRETTATWYMACTFERLYIACLDYTHAC